MAYGDYATLQDNFDRADEGPPPSASWTNITNGLKVATNVAAGNVGTLSNNISFWNVATFGADCEAYATISTKSGNNQPMEVYARMTTLVSGTMDGYMVRMSPASGTDAIGIYRIDNGAATALTTGTQEFASGEKLGIEIIGSTIKLFHFTGGAWNERLSTSDTTYSAAGYVGLNINHTTGRFNDFYAGTIVSTIVKDIIGAGIIPFAR